MPRPVTFNLADLLEAVADAVPDDREALVCASHRVSFRELIRRTRNLALWLRAQGIVAGDTIGIHSYNCIEFVEATFAAYMLKAIPVNINYRYTPDEARYLYDDAQLKGLVYGATVEHCVSESLDAAPDLRALVRIGPGYGELMAAVSYESALAAAYGSLDDIERADGDLTIIYTGGTTGMPKGVLWSHKDLFFAALGGGGSLHPAGPIETPAQLADRVRGTWPMRVLPGGPLMHGNGMWTTIITLFGGGTVILNEYPSLRAEYILDLVVRENVNCLSLIGDAMFMPLIGALKKHPGRWDLSGIAAVANGGALLSEAVREEMRIFLPPNTVILDSIGSSETGTLGAGTKPKDGGLVCLPPSIHSKVVVDSGRFALPGETGILARMGYLPVGYYRDPQKTAATFVEIDGKRCALSGDMARLEQDGSITVFGRGSQCINTGGEKVFAEEVEEVLRSHHTIADAIVVGVPDPRWGQKVTAVVSVCDGAPLEADEMKRYCRERLAGYKVPKDVIFVDEVVRNPMGKADYRWARATAEQALLASTPE